MQDESDSYYERVTHYSPERIAPFNTANKRSPQARETERRLLIDRLDLSPGLTVVDTGAGGGYLVDGFPHDVVVSGMVICTDTAEHFIATIPAPFVPVVCGMDSFPLPDDSVDRVCNLAGLHHVQHKDRFFTEAARVLKPGGRIAVADVRKGTKPATWLNGPVDRFTDIGHDGMFVEAGDFSAMLAAAGFVEIEETHEIYCAFDQLAEVSSALQERFGEASSVKPFWRPQNTIGVEGDKAASVMKLIDSLEDNDDVQNVYANFEISDEEMERLAG